MAFTNIWDTTQPPDSQLASLGATDFRNLRLDIQQRMGAISGLDASKPAFGSDAQPANWTGVLYFATDTGCVYQWNGSTWVTVVFSGTDSFSTNIVNPGAGISLLSTTIPANALSVGKTIEIIASVVVFSATSYNLGIGFGGTNITQYNSTSTGTIRFSANGIVIGASSEIFIGSTSIFTGASVLQSMIYTNTLISTAGSILVNIYPLSAATATFSSGLLIVKTSI